MIRFHLIACIVSCFLEYRGNLNSLMFSPPSLSNDSPKPQWYTVAIMLQDSSLYLVIRYYIADDIKELSLDLICM
jgi:hypothetical protein